MKILVTGAAGFIGYYVAKKLLSYGEEVVGIDNLNDYYDVNLKISRIKQLGINESNIEYKKTYRSTKFSTFKFVRLDITDRDNLYRLFSDEQFEHVINLAAQAGVRYSLENPFAYIDSNINGFVNLLECCRHFPVKHFIYASSSSVYGGNIKTPFSENDRVEQPVSLYAATKVADELIASCYSKLYNIPSTGLRFFTVYGPWGRPDMAPILFTKAILAEQPIKIFNNGNLLRDFTYIDDIVEGVLKINSRPPTQEKGDRRHIVYNIGCSKPIKLMDFVKILEKELGKNAKKIYLPMQQGDVFQTFADTSRLEADFNFKPKIQLSEGVHKFVKWWKSDLNPLK